MVHFVHRDSLFEDYIFSIGYYLTLQPDGTHVDLFPGFKNFALDDEGKSDSNIAGAFKRKWKQLFDIIKSYMMVGEDETNKIQGRIDFFV